MYITFKYRISEEDQSLTFILEFLIEINYEMCDLMLKHCKF